MTAPRPRSRHSSREAAVQVLYAIDLGARGSGAEQPLVEDAFAAAAEHFELPEGARGFARELVAGVIANREPIDAQIAHHARNWRLSRMAALDRNVLRVAVYEILFSDTAPAVILDEAVELARRFGGERSPAFVNGILDAVARSSRDAPAPPSGSAAP